MSAINAIGIGVAVSLIASSFAVFVKFGSVQEAVMANTEDAQILKEFRQEAIDGINIAEVRDEQLRARVFKLEQEYQQSRSTMICILAHLNDEQPIITTLKCITEGVNNE